MCPIPPEYAKAGGRSSASAREINSQVSGAFKSPFDVLYKKDEEPPHPKTTRIRTAQGTIVQFPDNWKRGDGQPRKRTTLASDESGAPKFKLGDHQLDLDVAERLNALPGRRYVR